MVDVLRNGIKDYGVHLHLAYFQPPTSLNQDLILLVNQNRLSVTEELVYKDEGRVDLVIFLNGLPTLAFELKNEFTGQDVDDAKHQWMYDRSGNDTLFRFKERVIACFAMDTNEVFMTTRLNGTKTFFLPFNKGDNNGKGNPIVDGKLKTHYVWEDVLSRDSLLEILDKFVYLKVDEEENDEGKIITKETLVFPRYHQRDAVKKCCHTQKHGVRDTPTSSSIAREVGRPIRYHGYPIVSPPYIMMQMSLFLIAPLS